MSKQRDPLRTISQIVHYIDEEIQEKYGHVIERHYVEYIVEGQPRIAYPKVRTRIYLDADTVPEGEDSVYELQQAVTKEIRRQVRETDQFGLAWADQQLREIDGTLLDLFGDEDAGMAPMKYERSSH
ncbi:hypothetical protein FGG69_gp11 [Salinibacter phage SRUTV-1]|uniref:Uncharacterized protein n=1 Tax=Salinibacter phage SRUTV-1 TaxID=2684227 RepID=A0A2D3FAI5_9CAUD|nr:hypothetical protein FGG69_gp11 [Salinibacter phage SRUTV-1]ATU47033.1 hypothetical protein [Salinibacter phage SRUTV-1]AUO79375.1 hypothetical protein [Salinibacter virus M31CR41-3]